MHISTSRFSNGIANIFAFNFRDKSYQFWALCYGPTCALRVFVKAISVMVAFLRKYNVRLASYVDDWLSVNKTRPLILEKGAKILNLLFHVRFIINKAKSQLFPLQTIVYIGGRFDLTRGMVYPTEERLNNLKTAVKNILNGQKTARHFLILLGMIASCLELIPYARLFNTASFATKLESIKNGNVSGDPSYSQTIIQSELVVTRSEHCKGQISSYRSVSSNSNHRCKWQMGLGRPMNSLTCQGQWSKFQK